MRVFSENSLSDGGLTVASGLLQVKLAPSLTCARIRSHTRGQRQMPISTSPHASSRELKLTVGCLELYYRQGQSQKDIAKALGVSAATVSRLLKRAFDDGFVRVELDLPRTEQLEAALTQKFGLREAVVIVSGGRGDVKAELGAAAAAYFEKIARNGMRIGLSCGF